MLTVRKAETADLNRIMQIYRIAQDFMIETGNPNQWKHSHPSEEQIKDDIENGICHVILKIRPYMESLPCVRVKIPRIAISKTVIGSMMILMSQFTGLREINRHTVFLKQPWNTARLMQTISG